jgi:pyruvate, water dikinase
VQLAAWCLEIEEHYGRAMDIEWAKDGETGELYIVQARPETVHSGQDKTKFTEYRLKNEGNIITTGTAIGEKITKGISRILSSPDESAKLKKEMSW